MNKTPLINYFTILIFTILMLSCGETTTDVDSGNNLVDKNQSIIDSNSTLMLSVDGIFFSIPSPIQTALFISESGAEFNSEVINPAEHYINYSNDFYRALNLGVYGTDLSYAAINENNDISLRYLSTVRDISNYLGLENAFNEQLLERFGDNLGNKDSMLVFVSESYRNVDTYLKSNDKNDVAALILTGGWIEAMYISTQAYKETGNENIKTRIAEQKNTLKTLFTLLEKLSNSDDYLDLTNEIEELYMLYDEIEYSYEYVAPITKEKDKTTTIRSKTNITVSDELMNTIMDKLTSIRNEITE